MGVLDKSSETISKIGTTVLGKAARVAKGVLGEDLAGQLFDNYVPLERYTEYQRTYNWEVVFPFLMGDIPGPIVSKYCKAVAFGDYQFKGSDITEVQIGPKSFFVPGTLSINSVTMLFVVPFPNLVQGYFAAWKKSIVSSEGYYAEQIGYKKTAYVRTYTTQGITSGTIKFIGMFPRSFYEYKLSYDEQNIVKYSVSFSIDDITFSGFDLASSIPRVLKHLI